MLKVCLEMNLLKYGFVGLLLLASALFIAMPTQNQEVFGQGTNTTNATETEKPAFDGQNPGFVPNTEDGAAPPPPPADATTVDELPNETLVKDPDSDALSISNRTEILEVLPANSSKIIKFVDEDLKNSTGVGLAPTEVLQKLTSEAKDNKSILQLASPEEVKEIESAAVNATGAGSEEDDEVPPTNATGEESNVTAVTGEEQQAGEESNVTATNATAVTGELPAQTREEQKQAEGEEEQALTAEEEAQAGGEEAVTNAPNATATETPEGLLNTTNLTSMLNATDSEDDIDNPEDEGEDK